MGYEAPNFPFNVPWGECILEIGPQETLSTEDRPMKTWMKPFAVVAVLALGATACEDGSTNTNDFDDDGLVADAALIAADGMFQDLAHMASPGDWGGMGAGPEAVGIEIQGSRTFNRTVTFFPENSYHPLTTTHMQIVTDLTRQVTHTFWSADITRHRDMMVTGMGGEETSRVWDGTGTGTVSKSRHPDGGSVRTYDMQSTATIRGDAESTSGRQSVSAYRNHHPDHPSHVNQRR